jgi:hypothetical protein
MWRRKVVKTYSRRVFGGKDAVWIGIDQGKHPLYPSALEMSMNAIYDENVFKSRPGATGVVFNNYAGVLSASRSDNFIAISSGLEVFAEETI